MGISLSAVSPAELDSNGGTKLTIDGDFSEHVGQDFEVVCLPRGPGAAVLALTGRSGVPTTIQPLNASRMVCYAPRLSSGTFVQQEDPLDSDLGYWRPDPSYPSSINFSGGIATVQGTMFAEIPGWSTLKNYSVSADAKHNSGYAAQHGWFGLGVLSRGSYFLPDGNGYGGLINTLDSNAYALKVVNGVISFNAYPVTPTLVYDTWYHLECAARSLGGSTVGIELYVDGKLAFSEQHSGAAQSGAPALGVTATYAPTADFDNMRVQALADIGQGLQQEVVEFDLLVRLVSDPSVSAELEQALRVFPKQYNSCVFDYRGNLPPTYRTGPREPGLLGRIA